MSFYGNITNVPSNNFTFDKYYPNRKIMENAVSDKKDDGVFIGRYVAIEYNNPPYEIETTSEGTTNIISLLGEDLKLTYSDGTITGATYKGREILINTSDSLEYKHYKINSAIDDTEYQKHYDSTGWVKERQGEDLGYKEIADLNGVIPEFNMVAEPPTVSPKAPHMDEIISKIAYDIHWQPQWGFRLKPAKGGDVSSIVVHGEIDTDGKERLYIINPENTKEQIDIEFKGGIPYGKDGEALNLSDYLPDATSDINLNIAGFDSKIESTVEDPNYINLLPSGSSGKNQYSIHNFKDGLDGDIASSQPANDMYELSIHLPALGNAVSEMWNIVYGPGDSDNALKRNTNISWNNTTGIRNVDTLAGCINTIHDLMGQILVFAEKDENGNIQFRFPDSSIKTEEEVRTSSNFDIYSKYIYVFENGKHYKLCKMPDYSKKITKPTNNKDAFYLATFEEGAEYCVTEDENGIFNQYSLWNTNNIYVPSSVTLAKIEYKSKCDFKEITNSFNSIYNLLLNTIDLLGNFNDNENRNKETVQGCINIINDIITRFDNLKPYNVLSTDEFGRVSSTEGIGDFQLINYNDRIESKGGSNEKVAVKRYVGYIKGTFNGEIKISNDVDSIGFADENRSLCTEEELNDDMPQFSVVLHELNNYNNFRSGWGVYSGNNFILTSITNSEFPASGSTYLVTRGDSQEPHAPQGYYYLYSPQKTQNADIDGKKDSLNSALRKLENKANKNRDILAKGANSISVGTGYRIADGEKEIEDTDSISSALGKLEYKVDNKLKSITTNDTSGNQVVTGLTISGDKTLAINSNVKNVGDMPLTGYTSAKADAAINSGDSINAAIGKLEYKIDNKLKGISLDTQPSNKETDNIVTKLELSTGADKSVQFKQTTQNIGHLALSTYIDDYNYINSGDTINKAFEKVSTKLFEIGNPQFSTILDVKPKVEKEVESTIVTSIGIEMIDEGENEGFNTKTELVQKIAQIGDLKLKDIENVIFYGYEEAEVYPGYSYIQLNNNKIDFIVSDDVPLITGLILKDSAETIEDLEFEAKINIKFYKNGNTSPIGKLGINSGTFKTLHDKENNYYSQSFIFDLNGENTLGIPDDYDEADITITRIDKPNSIFTRPTGYIDNTGKIYNFNQFPNLVSGDSLNNALIKLQTKIDSKVFDTSVLVGQKTEQGGEIFNDYENNQAIGPYTHASGFEAQAGITGYYFTDLIINEEDGSGEFQLSKEQKTLNTDFVINYKENDIISYVYGSKYLDVATITSIDNNNKKITVKPLEGKTLGTGNIGADIDDQILYVKNKPDAGIVYFGHYAHAEGEKTRAIERSSHAEGRETIARGQYGHAEGRKTEAGYAAHAEGYMTNAVGNYSHTEGWANNANGQASHAEGRSTNANGLHTHAEGYATTAIGNYSHAEGQGTIADGEAAHTEGFFTEAKGKYSHSEGAKTQANGANAHAEGENTQANGTNAHAEGFLSQATNNYAHAEGRETIASGDSSHTEGYLTQATASTAHAEGNGTQAKESATHAEGYHTVASARFAHAEGRETVANIEQQHVEGKYNKYVDDSGKALEYAHVVGNGTSDSDRSNAHTLDWSGNAWFAGKISTNIFDSSKINTSHFEVTSNAAKFNNERLISYIGVIESASLANTNEDKKYTIVGLEEYSSDKYDMFISIDDAVLIKYYEEIADMGIIPLSDHTLHIREPNDEIINILQFNVTIYRKA